MRSRNTLSTFNLSFLDIMFCGFGAVVLLVLIINSATVRSRKEHHEDLRADVIRIEKEIKVGQDHLVELKNSLEEQEKQQGCFQTNYRKFAQRFFLKFPSLYLNVGCIRR